MANDSSTLQKAQGWQGSVFDDLALSPRGALSECVRVECTGGCGKKRRYYCSECLVPLVTPPQEVPTVTLPLFFEILQAGAENQKRSTAQHVPILAPNCARVWRPFPECRDEFQKEVLHSYEEGSVAVLYPGEGALTPEQALHALPNLKKVLVIDATWPKSVLLMSEPCLSALPRLTLPPSKATRFWRYAPKRSEHSEHFSPDKVGSLMSTVESVHSFCDAYNRAKGLQGGLVDDLLWLFAFLHGRVKEVYERNPGKRDRIMRKSKGILSQF